MHAWTHSRLMVITILRAKLDDALILFAIVCSTWVSTSSGSTQRTWITPMGNGEFPSVKVANLQAARPLVWQRANTAGGSENVSKSLIGLIGHIPEGIVLLD